MEQPSQTGVAEMLAKDTWGVQEYRDLLSHLLSGGDAPTKARGLLVQMEAHNPDPKGAAALKIGIARYALCRFGDALTALANATDNKDRHYFMALCYKQTGQFAKAMEAFGRAKDRGWEDLDAQLNLIEVQALAGDADGAAAALAKLESKAGQTAQYAYLQGLTAELLGFGDKAVDAYQKARAREPGHTAATFRLAYYCDLHGEEQEAIALYKECIARPPVHANALLNMAVLYEDLGQNDQSIICINRVLATEPNHPRARLFLKDSESSRTMFYDEDQAKRIARRNAVLDIPVTDFELSVRARNCLKKMNIRTLGDLVRTTEAELLSYKNFGETSLKEIKDMLTAKGLRLGQALEEGSEYSEPRPKPALAPTGQEGVLATPIDQVEFSIRARRALQSLNIRTLGDLASKTETDLMTCRNFGQTSLNEVRQRLAEYGMALREND